MKCFEYEYSVSVRLEKGGNNGALTGTEIGIGKYCFMVII